MATSIDNIEILELFLANPKFNPTLQDNIRYTALHDAVARDHCHCVTRLLKHVRVDSTIRTAQGQTALDLVNNNPFICSGSHNYIKEVHLHQQRMEEKKSGEIRIEIRL